MRPVAGKRRGHTIRGLPEQLGAHDLLIRAALRVERLGARAVQRANRIGYVGRGRGIRDALLVAILILRRKGDRRQQILGQRDVRQHRRIAAAIAAACDLSLDGELVAGRASHDADRAADGVAAEQRSLGTLEDFDALDIQQTLIRPHRASEVHAIDVHAHTRVEIECEVVLADAADRGR